LPPLGRVAGHDVPPSELELLDEPELELDELELEGLPELDPEAPELDPVPVPLELEPPELESPAPEPEPEDVPELEPEPELEPAEESAGPPPAASSPPPSGVLPRDDPQAIVAKRAKAHTVHVVLLIAGGIIRSRSGGQRRNPSRKHGRAGRRCAEAVQRRRIDPPKIEGWPTELDDTADVTACRRTSSRSAPAGSP
jgi:hypothetical protein